jgi:hypothetical protein
MSRYMYIYGVLSAWHGARLHVAVVTRQEMHQQLRGAHMLCTFLVRSVAHVTCHHMHNLKGAAIQALQQYAQCCQLNQLCRSPARSPEVQGFPGAQEQGVVRH